MHMKNNMHQKRISMMEMLYQFDFYECNLEEFKKHLEEFAFKHKKEINDNPVFRNEFLKMCKEIGVDPLSST